MSAPATVRLTRADENPALSAVFTDAFADEAGLNYWLKQGSAKERARRQFFDAAVRDAVHPHRAIHVAESDGAQLGAAMWLRPGQKAFDFSFLQEIALTPLLWSIAGASGMQRGMALGKKLSEYHPPMPHAHLVFLGVTREAQGRGVGSELLKQTLAPLDANKTPAYLECSTERNAALYQRHGFETTGEFDLPGLHMWTMVRQPR